MVPTGPLHPVGDTADVRRILHVAKEGQPLSFRLDVDGKIERATFARKPCGPDKQLLVGFRSIDGFAERVVYREFFPRGLTALDDLNEATLGTRPSLGHVTAREEVTSKTPVIRAKVGKILKGFINPRMVPIGSYQIGQRIRRSG